MFTRSIGEGIGRVSKRFRLVLLIYAVNLLIAFLLVLPVYYMLGSVAASSGYSVELMQGFDPVLWADILSSAGAVLRSSLMQLVWALPVFLLWKVASHVGLVYALQRSSNTDGPNYFWFGVGRYTGRALLLATLFLIPSVILCGLVLLLSFGLHRIWSGEVGGFWIYAVFAPLLLLIVLAIFNLMHDYGRIALLLENRSVVTAWRTGLLWPFKHRTSLLLYAFWFFIGVVLLMLPTLLSINVPTETISLVWILFLFQQLVLLARAWVNVAWIGSEVALFEDVGEREMSAHRFTPAPAPAFIPAMTPVPPLVPSPFGSDASYEEQAIEDSQRALVENTLAEPTAVTAFSTAPTPHSGGSEDLRESRPSTSGESG